MVNPCRRNSSALLETTSVFAQLSTFDLPECVIFYARIVILCGFMPVTVQAEVNRFYKEEYEAAVNGKYKESTEDWLGSSWQGDALQVAKSNSTSNPLGHSLYWASI